MSDADCPEPLSATMEMKSYEVCYYCVVGAIAAIIVLLWVGRRRLPPGPLALPFVGHLHLLQPNLHEWLSKLSDRYGPLMTIKLGMKTSIVVSSAAVAKEILRDHDQTFANRTIPHAGKSLSYDVANIVWCPYGSRWRLLRKMCVRELFNTKSMEGSYSLRKSVVQRMIRSVYKDSINGGGVDVRATAFGISLDMITNLMWSQTSATSTEGKWKEFLNIIRDSLNIVSPLNVSDLFPVLEMFDLQGLYRKAQLLRLRTDKAFDPIIEERLSGLSTDNDFLNNLVKLIKSGGHVEGTETFHITTNDVKAVLLDMMFGSTDTTSRTVEWAMAEVLRQPDIMKRVQKELEDVVGVEKMVEESDIAKLPYLQAIVKEALRLHPPAPLLMPHCPDKPCYIGGYLVPKDTQITINVWKIHRNPQVWENPLVFNPDRFMDSRWDYSGREFDYMPFGAGRRICVGLPMGVAIVHYTLASFLHCFEWSLPAGEKMDMSARYGIALHKAVPLIAIPKPRLLQAEQYYSY